MIGTRVVLITAAGPGGQIDVGVRGDATPADLVGSLGSIIGIGPGSSVVEHHAPPRPGTPQGRRAQLTGDASLASSGVADGDVIIFRKPSDRSNVSHRPWSVPSEPGPPRPGDRSGPDRPRRPGGSQPPVAAAPVGAPRRSGQDATRPRLQGTPPRPGADSTRPRQPAPPPSGHEPGRARPPGPPGTSAPGAPGAVLPRSAGGSHPGPGQLPRSGPARDERAAADRMYGPAHVEPADYMADYPADPARGSQPDSEVTRPDLPGLPRVDLPHAHVTRQADDSTRPAPRREPGAHRATNSGNGRSYRPGPTRGTESDEPDDRH